MIETYELISAHGDESNINLVQFLIHFDEDGIRKTHYSYVPLSVSLPTDSDEDTVIGAALNSMGNAVLAPIRNNMQQSLYMEKEIASNQVPYFKTLESAKLDKHRDRVEKRMIAINSGFNHGGHIVQSDLESRILIQGAAQLAQLALADGSQTALDQFAASLVGGWRAMDDTIVASDAAGMIALAQSLAQHVAACDANGQSIKAVINTATTLAELDAIDVAAGYPAV